LWYKNKITNLPPENWLKGKLKQYKVAFPSCYRHPNEASAICTVACQTSKTRRAGRGGRGATCSCHVHCHARHRVREKRSKREMGKVRWKLDTLQPEGAKTGKTVMPCHAWCVHATTHVTHHATHHTWHTKRDARHPRIGLPCYGMCFSHPYRICIFSFLPFFLSHVCDRCPSHDQTLRPVPNITTLSHTWQQPTRHRCIESGRSKAKHSNVKHSKAK